MQLFVDTGFLIALEVQRDQRHDAAVAHWGGDVAGARPTLVTTTYVLDEVVTWLNTHGEHAKAVEVGDRLLDSRLLELIHVDEKLLRSGWDYFCRHDDKTYSLTDCISFVVMAARGITTALAFDHHFEQAGFRIEP